MQRDSENTPVKDSFLYPRGSQRDRYNNDGGKVTDGVGLVQGLSRSPIQPQPPNHGPPLTSYESSSLEFFRPCRGTYGSSRETFNSDPSDLGKSDGPGNL